MRRLEAARGEAARAYRQRSWSLRRLEHRRAKGLEGGGLFYSDIFIIIVPGNWVRKTRLLKQG